MEFICFLMPKDFTLRTQKFYEIFMIKQYTNIQFVSMLRNFWKHRFTFLQMLKKSAI